MATDPLHCGSCEVSCASELGCVDGFCACPAGLVACGADCVELATNPLFCGSCAIACGAAESCVEGACVGSGSGGAGTGGTGIGGVDPGGTGGIATGGLATGGGATGGVGTGGTATGGAATGGAGTGGIATGGLATGGLATGGSPIGGGGTGGAATGGVFTGGTSTGGVGGGTSCATAYHSTAAATAFAAEYAAWKACWVVSAANGTYAVINSGSCGSGTWVVSEGIGYGMLAAVANGDRALFDGLWQFYKDHVDPARGLMNWSVQSTDAPGDNDSNAATDGDLDVAMALLQAEQRWGGTLADALALITSIRLYETEVCGGLNILRPGDRWGGCSDGGKINPSYFAPGYYRVFAVYDTANAAYWTKLADDSYPLLASYQAQLGGLVPEWAYVNGTIEGGYDYNACRTPWRVATDYAWFCTPAAKTFLDQIVSFVDAHGGIAGVPYAKNSAFLGGFALSGLSASQVKIDAYVPLWLSTAQAQDNAYYQGSLRLVYALLAGDQFPSTL